MEELRAGDRVEARLHQLNMSDSSDMTYSGSVTPSAPEESCCSDRHGMDNNNHTRRTQTVPAAKNTVYMNMNVIAVQVYSVVESN